MLKNVPIQYIVYLNVYISYILYVYLKNIIQSTNSKNWVWIKLLKHQ